MHHLIHWCRQMRHKRINYAATFELEYSMQFFQIKCQTFPVTCTRFGSTKPPWSTLAVTTLGLQSFFRNKTTFSSLQSRVSKLAEANTSVSSILTTEHSFGPWRKFKSADIGCWQLHPELCSFCLGPRLALLSFRRRKYFGKCFLSPAIYMTVWTGGKQWTAQSPLLSIRFGTYVDKHGNTHVQGHEMFAVVPQRYPYTQ